MAWSRDWDNKIWIYHNNEDDFFSKIEQILSRIFNYLTYIEKLSLETSVPFSLLQKDERWVIDA